MPRWLKITFWIIVITAVLFVGITSGAAYLYRERVARTAQSKLQEIFRADFKYEFVSFDYFTKLGELTLSFYNFQVNAKDNQANLAKIGKLRLAVSVWDLFNQRITTHAVYVEEGDFRFQIDKQGKADYANLWQTKTPAQSSADNLRTIYLQNTKIIHENKLNTEIYRFTIAESTIQLNQAAESVRTQLKAKLAQFQFLANNQILWEQKEIQITSEPALDIQAQRLTTDNTQIRIKEAQFALRGTYNFRNPQANLIDLKLRGRNNDFKPLLAFLPDIYYENWADYKIRGSLNFSGTIKGIWSNEQKPDVEIDFGGKNLTVLSPHTTRQSLEEVSFEGKFSNGEQNGLASASVRIQNLKGRMGKQRFQGNLYAVNPVKPYLSFDVEAGIDLGAWQEFYPIEAIDRIKGLLGIQLAFDGEFAQLRRDAEEEKEFAASGEAELFNAEVQFRQNDLFYSDFNARWLFNNNQVEIKNFKGKVGNSDIQLIGSMQNLLSYWLLPNQRVLLKGGLNAKNFDLDELLRKAGGSTDKNSAEVERFDYTLVIPTDVQLNLALKIDSLRFRRFRGAKFTADISLKEKVFKSGNISLQTAGGTMNLLGILNAQKENFVTLDGRVIFKNVDVKRIFYTFENFAQSFLLDKNLGGALDADVVTGIVFDKHLRPSIPGIAADIHSRLYNGELKDFVLLEDIGRKVQVNNLKSLRFREMRNILQIRNKTVFIPETEIAGASIPLSLIGRSTTDKGLDYKVRLQTTNTPVNPTASVVKMRNGAVHYLTVRGNPESFRVNYTESPPKTKLEENWQREKQSYLKLFNKQSRLNEPFKIDTIRIGYFP
jgi:hypothetical protein